MKLADLYTAGLADAIGLRYKSTQNANYSAV